MAEPQMERLVGFIKLLNSSHLAGPANTNTKVFLDWISRAARKVIHGLERAQPSITHLM